jgi:hypothetical protein
MCRTRSRSEVNRPCIIGSGRGNDTRCGSFDGSTVTVGVTGYISLARSIGFSLCSVGRRNQTTCRRSTVIWVIECICAGDASNRHTSHGNECPMPSRQSDRNRRYPCSTDREIVESPLNLYPRLQLPPPFLAPGLYEIQGLAWARRRPY